MMGLFFPDALLEAGVAIDMRFRNDISRKCSFYYSFIVHYLFDKLCLEPDSEG